MKNPRVTTVGSNYVHVWAGAPPIAMVMGMIDALVERIGVYTYTWTAASYPPGRAGQSGAPAGGYVRGKGKK